MRILFLHPEDSPRSGPWTRERWDLLVDLGKTSQFSADDWERQCGCPILRADSYRRGIADAKQVREIFAAGMSRLIDDEGIDWWDLISLLLVPEALDTLAFRRVAGEIDPSAELWATRLNGPVNLLMSDLLGCSVRSFEPGGLARSAARARHYAGMVRRFPPRQIKEIIFDKYDSGYQWRSRFAGRSNRCAEPVVLIPSAYGNVSRMAAAYAQLLPRQKFLVVTTRHSGRNFAPAANMVARDLAGYAKPETSSAEITSLVQRWAALRKNLECSAELQVLARAGTLESVPTWIRDGIAARDAWREVLEREPVSGILCGDDSNRYTRLPVLLGARRKIPTVDFHHGAFDGRYLFKTLPCDVYLAKNEMERDYLLRVCGLAGEKIALGAPAPAFVRRGSESQQSPRTSVIFFSEPYEAAGARVEEIYREVLPPLARMVSAQSRRLILKLHPFESRAQRCKLVREILSPQDRRLVTVVEGPLTEELMSQAWFGITLESTSVVDCVQNGIPCFLCGWLTLFPYEYVEQYARFGVGRILQEAKQIAEIPQQLLDEQTDLPPRSVLAKSVDPEKLEEWLTARHDPSSARPAS